MMNGSASPKPASGPVRGLTSPILIARDCAFAGMTRRMAGAATAAMPALTRARRDGRDFMGGLPWDDLYFIPSWRAKRSNRSSLAHAYADRDCFVGTDLGFTRDRQVCLRKSGRPDLRGLLAMTSGVVLARLLQMLQHFRT